MKEETKQAITDIVKSEVEKIVGNKILPSGYVKCKKCGHLIPTAYEDKCPYCAEVAKPDDEDDDL